MGRPRLDLGTYGDIRVYMVAEGNYKAETYFRDYDGKTRAVKRHGASESEAKRRLKKAITERQNAGGTLLSADSYFRDAAKLWMAEVQRLRRGTTYDTYRSNLNHRVLPTFGDLKLQECKSVQLVHQYLRRLEQTQSANHVRGCRSVLSGVLGMATRMGAIPTNPVRDAGRIEGGAKKARALTVDERLAFLTKLDADKRAVADDLPDLMRYMMGTGVRIGEALGLRWFRVDFEQGLAVHGDNLVYEVGNGLVLHEPKTPAGFRIIPLPDFVLTMLRVRYPGPGCDHAPIFPACITGSPAGHQFDNRHAEAMVGKWRHPRNVRRSITKWREAKGNEEFAWFTSHVMRKTAITIMDQQGLSPRSIAGYVGQARPSFTMDTYMDIRPQGREASDALDRAMRPERG